MVSILGLSHLLNAAFEIATGAVFVMNPALALPSLIGNAAAIEMAIMFGFAIIILGICFVSLLH